MTTPARRYDVALLDLDGVVYLGPTPVPGAPEALAAVRAAGMRLAFVTNNASRTAEAVAELLRGMGVQADPAEVVTSSQAACHVLAERLPAGAPVLVVGGEGLHREAADRGFKVVAGADDEPAAVVQGYGAQVGWRELAEVTVAVRRGAWWVATNLDLTIPSVRGPLPGNGSLVGVVAAVTGRQPQVTGKPDPAMHRESVQRSGARDPLVVGDRLDTDVAGASRVGCDSLLVLTGVTTPADLLAAGPEQRPTYVTAGLDGLLEPYEAPVATGDGWACGGWTAGADLRLSGAGDDPAALRALCAAAWAGSPGPVRPSGAAAAAAVERLGLAAG
ncbi:MAG TPA: HAD-IIA family hydrolase [Mycobacteriales bacterium]|nr:HAD-IIA family hydrolase [Mycobacteriales bacterium]